MKWIATTVGKRTISIQGKLSKRPNPAKAITRPRYDGFRDTENTSFVTSMVVGIPGCEG